MQIATSSSPFRLFPHVNSPPRFQKSQAGLRRLSRSVSKSGILKISKISKIYLVRSCSTGDNTTPIPRRECLRLPVGVKRRFLSSVHFCPFIASKTRTLPMSTTARLLPATGNICCSGFRASSASLRIKPPVQRWGPTSTRFVRFATRSTRRQASSMASESYNSSDSDARNQSGRNSPTGENAPYAARAKAGSSVSNSFFPMGYREGFSQWVR